MFKKVNRLYIVATSSLSLSLVPLIVRAEGVVPVPGTTFTVAGFLDNVLTWVLGFTGLIAILAIIYGGIMYMLSAGDDTKAGKAKKIIFGALIGVAVIVAGYILINFVVDVISGGGPSN